VDGPATGTLLGGVAGSLLRVGVASFSAGWLADELDRDIRVDRRGEI
jgi:hypothetical protein